MLKSLWGLRGYLRGSVALLIVALAVMGVASGLNAYTVRMIGKVFEPLFKSISTETLGLLYLNALMFLALALGAGVTNAVGMYLADLLGQKVLLRLRRAVFDHLQSLSMAFFEHRRSGELISRVNNDTVVLQRALGTDLSKAVGPLTVLFMIAWMFSISWRLTVAIGISVPMIFALTSVMGRYFRRYAQRTQERVADLTANTQESFSAIRIVKTFGLEDKIQERFGDAAGAVFAAEMKAARVKALGFPVILGMVALATCLTLVLGGYEILHGRMAGGVGGLMSFLFLLQGTAAELNSASRLYLTLQQAEAAAYRTQELLEEEVGVRDAPDAIELEQVEGRVSFDHVRFAYDGQQDVLHDFSLDIAPGEVVALAGPSGAGKTTVANLVPRLYDPVGGAVLVDGVDVREVKQDSLKRFMGMVPQETILFGTTIRENIGLDAKGATEAEIVQAARAANAHEFIMGLPEGYDTQVGERGALLSGGQRQRIAIARAFLRDPRILILDEATSALDNESERAVHAALKTLMQDRTAIIIAHRLSTIQDADRIVVMDGGRIMEQGTHEELLARDGLYRRLYESHELLDGEPAAGASPPAVPSSREPGTSR